MDQEQIVSIIVVIILYFTSGTTDSRPRTVHGVKTQAGRNNGSVSNNNNIENNGNNDQT